MLPCFSAILEYVKNVEADAISQSKSTFSQVDNTTKYMCRKHPMNQSRAPRGVVARIAACMLLFGCLSCTQGSVLRDDRQDRQVSSAPPGQLLAYPDQDDGQELTQFERVDGTKEVYYAAGDPFLTASFDLMDRYWSEIAKTDKRLLRGHLDNYLPIALKQLNHKPAEAMMRSFADSFFSARNPQTGLIPYSYNEWSSTFQVETGGKQPVVLVEKGVELYQWIPNDPVQKKVVALALATMKYFDFELQPGKKGGMWNYVDVKSGGEPRSRVARTQDFGAIANGLAYLSQKTGDPKFLKWADQKLEFVWQHRMNQNLPLLAEQFTPTSALIDPEEKSSDTDTLYHVQLLFNLYDLTGEKKYQDWAIAVTNLWFEQAWNENWGHFVRKLNLDGTPAVDELYGDGKYNTLYILVDAYQVTKDAKYIDRFKQAWSNLLKMGKDGFVPQRVERGKMVDKYGLDKQQTIFLDILVAAYEASKDQEILQQAQALGKRILERGETVMRLEGGQAGHAFLRLALAQQKIRRLEVALGKAGTNLTVTQNGKSVLKVKVPAEVAVVYLPEGRYNIEVLKDGLSQKESIRLYGDKQVNL